MTFYEIVCFLALWTYYEIVGFLALLTYFEIVEFLALLTTYEIVGFLALWTYYEITLCSDYNNYYQRCFETNKLLYLFKGIFLYSSFLKLQEENIFL